MLGYDFEIIYKKGKQNVVANALSIKHEEIEGFIYVICLPRSKDGMEAISENMPDNSRITRRPQCTR